MKCALHCRADEIREASDPWEMEVWLAEQREPIDRTFDSATLSCHLSSPRCSATVAFAKMDVRGLAQDKVDTVHGMVRT